MLRYMSQGHGRMSIKYNLSLTINQIEKIPLGKFTLGRVRQKEHAIW